jgi:hypothetical protein
MILLRNWKQQTVSLVLQVEGVLGNTTCNFSQLFNKMIFRYKAHDKRTANTEVLRILRETISLHLTTIYLERGKHTTYKLFLQLHVPHYCSKVLPLVII